MNDQYDPNALHPRKSRSDKTTTRSLQQASFHEKTCEIRSIFLQLSGEIDLDTLDQYKNFCKNMINDFSSKMSIVQDRVYEQREDELDKLRQENLKMKEKLAKVYALMQE